MVERRNVISSNDTVTVACKMPNGLRMRLFRWVERPVEELGGRAVRMVREAQPIEGQEIVLKGYYADARRNFGKVQLPSVPGAYALTYGVPRDFWEQWLEQNKDADYVKNNLVFAHSKSDHVVGMVDDHADTKCGLEALDPDHLPREFSKVKTYNKSEA